MDGPAVELPQYRCHKIVRAARITGFRPNGTDAPDLLLGEIGGIVSLLPEWHEKHRPQIGGFFVRYEDGYTSFSPATAFEEGYAPFTVRPDVRGVQQHLSAIVCKDADDAISQGFDYAAQGEQFKPIEIEKAVVVQDGTEGGSATVDFVLVDRAGQRYVVMLTGALIRSIPC